MFAWNGSSLLFRRERPSALKEDSTTISRALREMTQLLK
jgi:hypothetical protein